jgi:hypothetical protein
MNASLTKDDLDRAAEAFQQAGEETGAI